MFCRKDVLGPEVFVKILVILCMSMIDRRINGFRKVILVTIVEAIKWHRVYILTNINMISIHWENVDETMYIVFVSHDKYLT